MPRGKRCIAHAHEYLAPEEYHHVQPLSRGGLTKPDNMVWLCANAHSDVHYFLDLIEKRAKQQQRRPEAVPGAVADHFGPKIRQIARRGWAEYADEFMSGRLDAFAMLWTSAGEPTNAGGLNVPPFWLAARRSEAEHWLSLARMHTAGTSSRHVVGWDSQ